MAEITASRLAMYEGIIALAWADHHLDAGEIARLHELINNNPRFTSEQREELHGMIDNKVTLDEVWPKITDAQDRAYLLDVADTIFIQDGDYSGAERELYETFLEKHLKSVNSAEIQQEIKEMTLELRAQRKVDEAQAEADAKGFRMRFLKEMVNVREFPDRVGKVFDYL